MAEEFGIGGRRSSPPSTVRAMPTLAEAFPDDDPPPLVAPSGSRSGNARPFPDLQVEVAYEDEDEDDRNLEDDETHRAACLLLLLDGADPGGPPSLSGR